MNLCQEISIYDHLLKLTFWHDKNKENDTKRLLLKEFSCGVSTIYLASIYFKYCIEKKTENVYGGWKKKQS